MKKTKFSTDLQFNIHTLSVRCENYVEGDYRGVELIKVSTDKETGVLFYTLKINPNKFVGREILSIVELEAVLVNIVERVGASAFQLSRVDLKLDSFGADDHKKNLKLNRLLVLLGAQSNNLRNRYESTDPLTLEHQTTVAKSDYYEIENYDKALQSNFKDEASNRLEFRSKALLKRKKTIREITQEWLRKLDSLEFEYESLQASCNKALLEQWKKENGNTVKNVGEFLRKHQNNIFSSKQLVAFLEGIGYTNPKDGAYRFAARNHIQYIYVSDIRCYVAEIKKSVMQFIANLNKTENLCAAKNAKENRKNSFNRERAHDVI